MNGLGIRQRAENPQVVFWMSGGSRVFHRCPLKRVEAENPRVSEPVLQNDVFAHFLSNQSESECSMNQPRIDLPRWRREGPAGTCVRLAMLLILVALATAVAWFLANWLGGQSLSILDAVTVGLVIGLPMGLSVVVSEYPRGVEFVFLRLAGATFCRTGLPLLAILLLSYSDSDWLDRLVFLVIFVYAVGFLTSVLLSVLRLNRAQDRNEVQSVA